MGCTADAKQREQQQQQQQWRSTRVLYARYIYLIHRTPAHRLSVSHARLRELSIHTRTDALAQLHIMHTYNIVDVRIHDVYAELLLLLM